MKINYLKINGFGKLENKEIELSNHINLIYGNNEAGKSTLLKFISSMFYGVSKNKNKKEFSDYERYKPWRNEEFSGKMIYKLDNNEEYEIYRDFNKKNPQIYNKNGEEISKNFNINKAKGNEFFYEQTKIEEEMLLSTSIIEQNEIVLDNSEQQLLTQKMANILSTGEENISYKKAIEKLNKKLLDEVGTERTTGRPINLINSKIIEINKEKDDINIDDYRKKELTEEIQEIEKNILIKNKKIELIKEIKKYKEQNILNEEKIKINKNIIEEENDKINNLKNQLKEENKKQNKKNYLLYISLIFTIINVLLILLNKKFIITLIALIVADLAILIINYYRKKQIEKIQKNNKNKIKNEIEIIENNIKNIEEKIKSTEKENEHKDKIKMEELKNKYNRNIEEKEINYLFKLNLEMLNYELENLEKNITSINLKLHTNKIDYNNLEKNEEKKVVLEEKLQNYIQEKEELQSLGNSINLVKLALERAYTRMKSEITPKFTENLSRLIEKISKGKYKNVKFVDGKGIIIELENGEYINANKLSIGTIDQLYLALRLSAMQEITEEKMPIILDEAFVYCDTERLTNILKYLNELVTENQIIILTCSNREREILQEQGIEHNFIKI